MNLKFILTMAWYYGIKTIVRGPSYIIASLSTPLTLLFLVFVLSHGALVKFAVVGGLIAFVGSVGLSGAGDSAFFRLQLRIQDLYISTNIRPFDYMIAFTLSYLVFAMPGIVLYVYLGELYHLFNLYDSVIMVLLMVSLIMTTTSISFMISGSIHHLRNIWGITGIKIQELSHYRCYACIFYRAHCIAHVINIFKEPNYFSCFFRQWLYF